MPKNALSINWKQVQEKLKPNEVAIDLVSFDFYYKKWTGEVMYGAFVITRDSKFPKYISLFEEKALSKLLERNNLANDTIQANAINKQYMEKALASLFFEPLKNELKNKEVCYLSLSGLAHQVNFTVLDVAPFIENKKAMKFHILNSPSELLSYQSARFSTQKNMEFQLFGGINYEKSNALVSKETTDELEMEVTIHKDLETRSGIEKFGYLNGTYTEVKQIEAAAKNKGFTTQLFTETNATEEQIKSLSGKTTPFVLHLATHGFFFPNPDKELPKEGFSLDGKSNFYKMSDDPMFRSGLLLAGANKFWRKPNNEKIEDGILTANEISNLDLSACQLVVLSACETGLGQIKGSEGVFGLQRAFKMAGVKNIIMSLWKVPDAQTSELFHYFYTECFNGKSVHDAFQSAQEQMKSKYNPYFWAGFILLE